MARWVEGDLKLYAWEENARCYAKLKKLLFKAILSSGSFYRRPLTSKFCGDTCIRFSKQKVGVHQFEGLMQKLVMDSGLESYFTGHSRRVNKKILIYINKLRKKSYIV